MLLLRAKRLELEMTGMPLPSEVAAKNAIKKEEMARHCRRRTRGTDATKKLIDSLLLSLSAATDTLGVPLFAESMKDVWEEQRQHVKCLQDPPGVQLYTITGHLKKGGINLPILRCARGSTSLESFHCHIARFIPGSSANAVNFQAYLIDGVVRWNQARAEAAFSCDGSSSTQKLRTFDLRLQDAVNRLSNSIHGRALFPLYNTPAAYTGELLGVEYLFHQTGEPFHPKDDDELIDQIDEGFGDVDDDFSEAPTHAPFNEDMATFSLPSEEDSDTDEVSYSLEVYVLHTQA